MAVGNRNSLTAGSLLVKASRHAFYNHHFLALESEQTSHFQPIKPEYTRILHRVHIHSLTAV